MYSTIDKYDAQTICLKLLNTPVAPDIYSHFINVGTNHMLDILEEHYFKEGALASGISCFKYVQGYYGSGKTQFIHSLAARAWNNNIVTAIVNVGIDCPFNSPLSIYKAVVSSFLPPPEIGKEPNQTKGIEVLVSHWLKDRLRKQGISDGQQVPPAVKDPIAKIFTDMVLGSRDSQALYGIQAIGKSFLDLECGGSYSVTDRELVAWVRGDNIRSKALKTTFGLSEPANDANALNRLKTIINFLRDKLGYRGFFIAFDEGTRTASFRRGSIKQKQAIENMLTMINENSVGEFAGVMFLYAATPDFRNDVISKYPALNDRIGSAAFSPGRPMVPFIDLDTLDTDKIVIEIGKKLLEVFGKARDIKWDSTIQKKNISLILNAEKEIFGIGSEIRRAFVYHFCIFLNNQGNMQHEIDSDEAIKLVQNNSLPIEE